MQQELKVCWLGSDALILWMCHRQINELENDQTGGLMLRNTKRAGSYKDKIED